MSTEPLATLLREGTAAAHQKAESVALVKAIFDGTVPVGQYTRFLHALRDIYATLEVALTEHASDPRIAPLLIPQLYRVPAIDKDLFHFDLTRGPRFKQTQNYMTHLTDISATSPHRLIAHAYTRYLGDLSGGQALRKSLIRAFKLEGGRGTAFYEFPGIPDPTTFKDEYRAKLNALPLNEVEQCEVVDEAVLAFELNTAVMRACGGEDT